MLKLERHEIDQTSNRISINVNQKKNALVNIFISAGIIGFVIYMISTYEEVSFFYYVLTGVVILWFIMSLYGFRSNRSYKLTNQIIEYHSSNRTDTKTLLAGNLSYIS